MAEDKTNDECPIDSYLTQIRLVTHPKSGRPASLVGPGIARVRCPTLSLSTTRARLQTSSVNLNLQVRNPEGGSEEGRVPDRSNHVLNLNTFTMIGNSLVVELSTVGSTKAVIANAVRIQQLLD